MKRGSKGKDNKQDKMNDKGGKKESEAKIQKPKVGKKRDRSSTLSDQASSGSIYSVEDNDVFLARVLQPQIDDKKPRPSARKQSEVKEAETKPALLDDTRLKMFRDARVPAGDRVEIARQWNDAQANGTFDLWINQPAQRRLKFQYDKIHSFIPGSVEESKHDNVPEEILIFSDQKPQSSEAVSIMPVCKSNKMEKLSKLVATQRLSEDDPLAQVFLQVMQLGVEFASKDLLAKINVAFAKQYQSLLRKLNDPAERAKDPLMELVYDICEPEDFLVMALTEAQDEGATAVYQQELANIAHEHYQTLRKDYDFSRIHVQCAAKLADFFGSYARTKMGSAQRVSWDIAAVSHAVILGHIKPFIDEALNAFYLENEGGRLSNSLRACLIDTSEDQMVAFTCIMKAIHRVYKQLSEETIRIVFKKQTVFASNVMLQKLNSAAAGEQILIVKLIDKVLATGDSISVFDGIAKLCAQHSLPVSALIQTYTDRPDKVRLTFRELSSYFGNNIGKTNHQMMAEIKDDKLVLNTKDKFVATKAKTEITEEEYAKVGAWVDSKLQESAEEVKRYFQIANDFLPGFKESADNGGWFVPSKYQMYLAAKLAHQIHTTKQVLMTLETGQGKTVVYFLIAMILESVDRQKYDKFLFLTISENLKVQTSQLILQHRNIRADFDVRWGGDFGQYGEYSIIFVDEADFYTKHHAIEWDTVGKPPTEVKLIGLASLVGKTFLLGSAYFSPSERMVVQSVLSLRSEQEFAFQSLKEIANGKTIKPDITHLTANNREELEHRLAQFFDQNKHAPIISFSELPIVADMLRRLAASASISVTDLKDGSVSVATIGAADNETGIFLLKADCGRGLDFKFATNASVLVIFEEKTKLTTQDVYQMAGRGNRQQGQPTATCILTNVKNAGVNGAAVLQSNSLQDGMESAKLAKNVHKNFATLNDVEKQLKVLKAIGDGDKWTFAGKRNIEKKVRMWLEGATNALN